MAIIIIHRSTYTIYTFTGVMYKQGGGVHNHTHTRAYTAYTHHTSIQDFIKCTILSAAICPTSTPTFTYILTKTFLKKPANCCDGPLHNTGITRYILFIKVFNNSTHANQHSYVLINTCKYACKLYQNKKFFFLIFNSGSFCIRTIHMY